MDRIVEDNLLVNIDFQVEQANGLIAAADNISVLLGDLEITERIVNHIKDIAQEEAREAIYDSENGIGGIVAMATGTGKSKIVLDCVNQEMNIHLPLPGTEFPRILIVVPTEKLRDENWKNEFIKWSNEDNKLEEIWDICIERTCYASLNKIKGNKYTLVVLDEGHNITPVNSEFFDNNEVEKTIVLTATLPSDEIKNGIYDKLGMKVVYQLDLDTAVKLRIVAPYNIYIVECNLESSAKTVPGGTKAKPFMATEKNYYNFLTRRIQQLMFNKAGDAVTRAKRKKALEFAILKRMKFIYALKSKQDIAKWLLDNMIKPEDRTIIFCGTIEQANELCEHRFHSKCKDTDLNRFIDLDINRLACVKALNEGHNIPMVDGSLVLQLDSNERNLVQRIGRNIRFRPGHEATIIVLVAIGTVDEKWVESAIEPLDKSKIKYVRFANLKVGNAVI